MPVMDLVDTFDLKGQKPCFVQFEQRAVQVMQPGAPGDLPIPKLSKDGVPMYVDIDFVTVRQPGGIDSVVYEVEHWFKTIIPMELAANRLNPEIAKAYHKYYESWKQGQEIPVDGTPIKNWSVPSPAQIKMMTDLNIRTVEELAALPDDGVRRLGMGGTELKLKAKAFLDSSRDSGKVAHEMASLKKTNELLQKNLDDMKAQLDALTKDKKKP